jgi:hypothetical protein
VRSRWVFVDFVGTCGGCVVEEVARRKGGGVENGMSRSRSEGKWSDQLLCRQNEGECIWDGKRFHKVVEVNRGSASSGCGLGL